MHEYTEPTPTGPDGRTVVEVFVSGWEIECCAPPPVVGGTGTWRLDFIGAGDGDLDRDHTLLVARLPDRTELSDGPVTALWADHNGPPPEPGRRTVRGFYYGNAHGPAHPDAPVTTGVVLRVRLVRQDYALVAPRSLAPVPGTLTLTDVRRSPRRFAGGPGAGVHETGVLLDLDVR